MKTLFVALTLFTSLSAHAYVGRRVEYRCEGRGASIAVVSDTEKKGLNIVGKIAGKDVDYWSHGARERDNVVAYKEAGTRVIVKVQQAGPYDGGQDSLWGSASNGERTINMTCFIGMGDEL